MFGRKKKRRFSAIYPDGKSSSCKIIVDKDTGVNYLFVNDGVCAGLTVMVDKDGKPIVTTPENEDEKAKIASFENIDVKPIVNSVDSADEAPEVASSEEVNEEPIVVPSDKDNE